MEEVIKHSLGLCGDFHMNILTVFVENPNIGPIFNYIKSLFK